MKPSYRKNEWNRLIVLVLREVGPLSDSSLSDSSEVIEVSWRSIKNLMPAIQKKIYFDNLLVRPAIGQQ